MKTLKSVLALGLATVLAATWRILGVVATVGGFR